MNIAEFISNYKNHPILFIGTGFSLRYLDNSYTWDSLLKHITFELTGNTEVFLDIKAKAKKDDGTFSYEKIATSVEKLYNETLSMDRNGKFKNINDEFYEKMENGIYISRFKIYLSKVFSELIFRESLQEEIVELKKVRKNIGSIITTNYDKLIENIFQFNSLIGNNILLSNPYGSVYKIHGCISEPDSIIMTEHDYEEFDKKYELIRAQLLSLFIHNPIIFIGYKVGDENIKKLLKTIFTYVPPNSELATKIKNNFLLIEHDKGSENTEVNDHDIVLEESTTIRVNKIKTDNFNAIYKAIASLQLPISAMDVRKVQSVVRDIYEGGEIQVKIVDDIDNLLNSEKVLAIGNVENIKYEYQTSNEMMENYFKIVEEDNVQLLKFIDKNNIANTYFFPIFAFSQINQDIQKSHVLKEQQKLKLRKILENTSKKNRNRNAIDNKIFTTNRIKTSDVNTLIYSILKSYVELPDVESLLRGYEDKQSTDYRRILCAYDFMKYSNGETL